MNLDLGSFEKALAALDRALLRAATVPADEELRDACIQRFEFTFELAWKSLKRRLERDLPNAQEVDAMSYRTLIRIGAEQGHIDSSEVAAWFVYRDKRNLTSHTYNEARAAEVASILPAFANHARALLTRLQQRGAQDA
jgi:nucleotidyltransferase substrate binding protein (TIGR01987 family)